MKKLYFLLPVLVLPVILILMSNRTGSPGGRTGSPGDNGNTCTGCHTGVASTAFAWITTNVPASGYVAGQTYTITATGTHPGVVRFGFELTVEDSQGTKVGTLQLTDPSRTKFINSNKAVTHTAAGTTPNGSSNSWTMEWVAPSGVEGNIGIHAAFNAANGNNNTSGDVIYKSSTFISPFIPPPPALASIDPNEGEQGESVQVTITGVNTSFTGTPFVQLVKSLATITASNVTVVSPTVLSAQFDIPSQADAGLWDLHVDNLTLPQSFNISVLSDIGDPDLARNNIYPNPAVDFIYVENYKDYNLQIFNSAGSMVFAGKVASDKERITLNSLQPGVYFARISKDDLTITQKLLII